MNVYDFDNTLYKGESTYDFFFFCLKKKPTLIKYVPIVLYYLYKYKKVKINHQQLIDNFNQIFNKVLKNEKELNELTIKFWDKNIHKLKENIIKNLKKEDIIITGSPNFLINVIKNKLKVEIISTKVNLKTKKIEFLCLGKNKVKIFKELYPNKKINNFYTDSMNDSPLMELASNVYLVKKDKIIKI